MLNAHNKIIGILPRNLKTHERVRKIERKQIKYLFIHLVPLRSPGVLMVLRGLTVQYVDRDKRNARY